MPEIPETWKFCKYVTSRNMEIPKSCMHVGMYACRQTSMNVCLTVCMSRSGMHECTDMYISMYICMDVARHAWGYACPFVCISVCIFIDSHA